MSDTQIEKLWNLHKTVLINLINGKSYPDIRTAYFDEITTLNYEEIMVKAGNLSFTDTGILVGAYPISPRPTDYEIEVDGIGKGYAMCAVDALGTAFTFQSRTTLRAKDKSTGNPIEITVLPNQTTSSGYNLWMTYKTKCDPGEVTALAQCPTINFHSVKPSSNPDANIIVMNEDESFQHAKSRFHMDVLIDRIRKVVETGQTLNVI